MFASKRKLLSAAVAGACATMSMPVWAQAAGNEPPAGGEVQTVVVTGFRSSLEKALDLKRAAIGQRDSIVAEDIGKFPEQNIADALVRLPGVEVVKDGNSNEGQRIQLRGLGSEYTVTTFNGAPVRATSAGSIGGSTRDFNYDVFPSELFGRVDVYKTPLAELEEGGVAGVIDLQTPRPFDKKGQVIRYNLTASYNDRSKFYSPRGNLLYSNTWGKWGFLAAVAKNRTHNGTAGFQSTGTYASYNQRFTQGNFQYAWNLGDARANLGDVTAAQLFDANLPRFFRMTRTDNERDRIGGATSLQFKGDQLEVSLDTLYSKLQDDSKNNYLNFVTNGSTVGANRALVPVKVSIDQNNNIQGTIGNYTAGMNTVLGLSETQFIYNAVNAKYRVNNELRLTGSVAVNKSDAWRTGGTISADMADPARRHTITFNTTKDAMFPDLSTDRDLLDPLNYNTFTYSGGNYQTEIDKQKTLRLGMQYDYGFWNIDAKLKAGVSQVTSTKIANQYRPGDLVSSMKLPDGRLVSSLSANDRIAFARQFLIPNDLTNIEPGAGSTPNTWLTVDRNFFYGTLNAIEQNRNSEANLGGTFTAEETVRAFYVQSDFEKEIFGRPLRANAGVRYVKTDSDVDNNRLDVKNGYFAQHLTGSYHNALPSASLSYDLTKDLVLRSSAGKTIKRSSISSVARSINVPNGGDLAVQLGNPELKPERSTNLDASIEWYFQKGGVLALSGYRKNIVDRPATSSTYVPFNTLGLPSSLFTTNVQTTLATDPATLTEVRSFRNAEAFSIKGLELTHQQNYRFLPYPFNNLGSILSLTSIKTAGVKRTYNNIVYELPIVPDRTIAATIYYEEGPFAFRTSYNKKSAFADFNNTALNPLGYQRWNNDRAYLDASVSWKFNNMFELRLDGSNLTSTRTYQELRHFEGRNGDPSSRLEGAGQAGRTFALTLRGAL